MLYIWSELVGSAVSELLFYLQKRFGIEICEPCWGNQQVNFIYLLKDYFVKIKPFSCLQDPADEYMCY